MHSDYCQDKNLVEPVLNKSIIGENSSLNFPIYANQCQLVQVLNLIKRKLPNFRHKKVFIPWNLFYESFLRSIHCHFQINTI